MYLCCRPPWWLDCDTEFHDQSLSKVEQRLELVEVGVPVRHQIFIATRPKTNWCFHCCWHKQSPDQYIGLLSKVLEDIVNVEMYSQFVRHCSSDINSSHKFDIRADCFHWWSSWSLPRYLRKCTTVLHNENFRLWLRDPDLTTVRNSGHLFHLGVRDAQAVSSCFLESSPVSRNFLGWRFLVVQRMYHFYHNVPQIKSKWSIHSRSIIKRNNFWFCGTMRHWRLLLAHPTHANGRSASNDT